MIEFNVKTNDINISMQSIKDIKQSNNKSKIFCLLFFNNNLYISAIGNGVYFFKKLCEINYDKNILIKCFDYDEFNNMINIFNNEENISCIFLTEKNELKIIGNKDKKLTKKIVIKSIEFEEIYNEKELITNDDSLYNIYLNNINTFFNENEYENKINLSFLEYLYNIQKTINLIPKNFSTLESCLHISDNTIFSISRSEVTYIYLRDFQLSLLNLKSINIIDIKTLTYIISICKKNNVEKLLIKKDKNKFIIYTENFLLILTMLSYESIQESRFKSLVTKINYEILAEKRTIKFNCDLNIFNEIFNIKNTKEDEDSFQRIKFILNKNSNILKIFVYESKRDENNDELNGNKYLFEFNIEVNDLIFDEILSKYMTNNNYENISIVLSKNILTNNSINILKDSSVKDNNLINICINIEPSFEDKIFNKKAFFVSINFTNKEETILVRKMATTFCKFN